MTINLNKSWQHKARFSGAANMVIEVLYPNVQRTVYIIILAEYNIEITLRFFFFFFLVFFFAISWAAPAAYGDSQVRGRIRAVAASLCQSRSNAGSEPRLQPTPQLTATPDRQPTEQGQGPNPQPHGS